MSGVFLSYAHTDLETARHVARALREAGVEVYDAAAVPAGTNLSKAISDGIEAADAFVFLISPRYSQRQWTQIELAAALSRLTGDSDGEARFVPVLLGEDLDPDTDVPSLLRRFAWVDFRSGVSQEGLRSIVDAVKDPAPAETFSEQLDAEEAVLSIRAEALRQRQEIRRREYAAERALLRRDASSRMSLAVSIATLLVSAGAIVAIVAGAADDDFDVWVVLALGLNVVAALMYTFRQVVAWSIGARLAERTIAREQARALRGAKRAGPD